MSIRTAQNYLYEKIAETKAFMKYSTPKKVIELESKLKEYNQLLINLKKEKNETN